MATGTGMGRPLSRGHLGSRAGTRGGGQGTAAIQPLGVGAHAEVKIADRPMTMHGLTGVKTGSLGPKRQVYDKGYYILELRKRCTDLQGEIESMGKEHEEARKDNTLYAALEKRYEALVKTVRSLEGDLADHNLATDKRRTDTRPEEVHQLHMAMKQMNDHQRQEVDQIFLERRSHEEEIQVIQDEILVLARAIEERLNELHPDQHREYEVLREESGRLQRELADRREELDQINSQLETLEGHFHSDVLRTRSQQLLQVRKDAHERLEFLENELRQNSLSVPEQREILLAKVKSDNADIVRTEKENSDLKMEKERLRAQIQEVAVDAQTSTDLQSDRQKYETLFAKDQEMSQFIDSFDTLRADEEKKLHDRQEAIRQSLENISTALTLKADVSPEGHLNDMQDELEFKNRQLHNSEVTQNRLESELQKRQGELEKIETLDAKISQELQQVDAKMKHYEEEIATKFDCVQELLAEGQRRIQVLEAQKFALQNRVPALRRQSGQLRLRHEARQQQLADDEAAVALEAQEQKIRQFGQTLHTLGSFIRQKTLESDCQGELSTCMTTSAELNKLLLERIRLAAIGM